MKSIFLLVAAGFLVVPAWGGPTLTLEPSGDISGLPGTEIGWGFTITNDANYIEINSSQFCLGAVDFPFCTLPEEGTFTDFIGPNDIVVGPPGGTDPDTVSQDFDPTLLTGVGSFDVSPSAIPAAEDIGDIVLTYDVYDADPNTSSSANLLSLDQVLAADATVTVGGSTAPEPGSFFPAAGAFLGFAAWRISLRRRRRLAGAEL